MHSHDQNFRGSFPECFANLFRNNSHEELTADDELGRSDGAVLASTDNILDLRVWKRSGIERDCRFELIIEQQERCHFIHLWVSYLQVVA